MSEDTLSARRREDFERWISGIPYGMSTVRVPEGLMWSGQYVDINVQRAYDAWVEASRKYRACVPAEMAITE